MSITPQDVPQLIDPSPGNRPIRPQEIGRIVQVLNAHRHPTMADDNAPGDMTRDSRETTDGATLRPAVPGNHLPATGTRSWASPASGVRTPE